MWTGWVLWPHHTLPEKSLHRAFQILTQRYAHEKTYLTLCALCLCICVCVFSQTSWWICWESWPVIASQSRSWSCSSVCWEERMVSGWVSAEQNFAYFPFCRCWSWILMECLFFSQVNNSTRLIFRPLLLQDVELLKTLKQSYLQPKCKF